MALNFSGNMANYSQGCFSVPFSCSQSIPNFQRKDISSCSLDIHTKKHMNSTVKSLSFPRGTTAPNSGSFSKRLSGSGTGPSWAKRGWKKLTGLAIGSTNKVNVLGK